MSKIYNNSITTTAGFNYNAPSPLDDRTVVEHYTDLATLVEDGVAYEGLKVYVAMDACTYTLTEESWVPDVTETTLQGRIIERFHDIDTTTINVLYRHGSSSNDPLVIMSEHSLSECPSSSYDTPYYVEQPVDDDVFITYRGRSTGFDSQRRINIRTGECDIQNFVTGASYPSNIEFTVRQFGDISYIDMSFLLGYWGEWSNIWIVQVEGNNLNKYHSLFLNSMSNIVQESRNVIYDSDNAVEEGILYRNSEGQLGVTAVTPLSSDDSDQSLKNLIVMNNDSTGGSITYRWQEGDEVQINIDRSGVHCGDSQYLQPSKITDNYKVYDFDNADFLPQSKSIESATIEALEGEFYKYQFTPFVTEASLPEIENGSTSDITLATTEDVQTILNSISE